MTKEEGQSPVAMLNLGLMEIRLVSASDQVFSALADTPSSPSLPTGRQAQDGVFRCDF